jgi:DNA-binding beta-propeller fold protein YncE
LLGRLGRFGAIVVAGSVLLAACSSGTTKVAAKAANTDAVVRPSELIPSAAGSISVAGPAANGDLWVLARSNGVATLHLLDVTNHRQLTVAPTAAGADSLALSDTGVLAVGIGQGNVGAVDLCDGTSGAACRSVPIGAPVRSVAFGPSATTLYVLDGNQKSASVTFVQVSTAKVVGSVGVALDAVDALPAPSERELYVIQPTGLVAVVSTASGKERSIFRVGNSARAGAISPSGGTLYVLKGAASVRNIAVVHVATESVRRVLPAPAGARWLSIGPSGTDVFVVAGSSAFGNVQVFETSKSTRH